MGWPIFFTRATNQFYWCIVKVLLRVALLVIVYKEVYRVDGQFIE
jgi:hypothetical protein